MKKQTKLQKGCESIRPIVEKVMKHGARCMEQLTDKQFGLVMERWLLSNGVSVLVYGGPTYRELFIEAAPFTNSWDALDAALLAAASRTAPTQSETTPAPAERSKP